MDTLALLCNLYGDGPQTLRRLREAGCGTLAALEAVECERLATLLRTSVRSARRFQNEGRLLRERSDPAVERPTAPAAVAEPEPEPEPEPEVPRDPLVADVLSAWRERDARQQGVVSSPVLPVPAVEPTAADASTAERLAEFEGADAALVERLNRAGIETPEDLRDADVLDLAGRGVGGYTRLLRLQFLARRALERARPAAAPRRQEREEAADVIVPAPPRERRGGASPEVPRAAPAAARFSPRDEPGSTPDPSGLEEELRRFAARGVDRPPAGADTAPVEDAGSSGPFA